MYQLNIRKASKQDGNPTYKLCQMKETHLTRFYFLISYTQYTNIKKCNQVGKLHTGHKMSGVTNRIPYKRVD